jgi:hypothetical protein
MTIVHADSFDIYGTDITFMTDGVYIDYQSIALVSDPDSFSTQRCLRFNANSDSDLRYALPSQEVTIGVAMRIYLSRLPTNENDKPFPIIWADADNDHIAYLRVETTGRIALINNGVVVATSASPVITAEGWWHVEAFLTCDTGGAAICEVRVEGTECINHTAFTTTTADVSQLRIECHDGAGGSGPAMYVKDFVVWDANGAANNDFLGLTRVVNLMPNADDTAGGWVLNGGATDFGILDNNPPLDATEYISADDTPPAAVIVAMENLPSDVTAVKGLVSFARAKKSDGGNGTLQVNIKSAASTDSGEDRQITAFYSYWRDVSETDPATGVAWTKAGVDALKIEIDRTA